MALDVWRRLACEHPSDSERGGGRALSGPASSLVRVPTLPRPARRAAPAEAQEPSWGAAYIGGTLTMLERQCLELLGLEPG